MITVVNRKTASPVRYKGVPVIYIGRPSPLGNPFSHREGTKALYRTRTRQEAIDNYQTWLDQHKNDFGVKQELELILSHARQGDVILSCWCKPKPCHGDIIKAYIESLL